MTMIQTRRSLIAMAAMAAAGAAFAQSGPPAARFTQPAFEAAQASGKPVVIEVTAPWCPTCKAQAPILKSLLGHPELKGVTLLTVDFDSQKDVLRRFNVQKQSTLIAFRGKTETARSTGDTTPAGIERLVRSAI